MRTAASLDVELPSAEISSPRRRRDRFDPPRRSKSYESPKVDSKLSIVPFSKGVPIPQIRLTKDLNAESTVRPDVHEHVIACAMIRVYRAAVGMCMVAVGSFILRTLV